MREGSEVAARTDGAPCRDVGDDAGIENAEEQLHGLDAGPGVPFRDRIRPQHHRGAHDLVRIRSSDPARVAAKQPHLELLRLIVRDRLGDEPPEARVDAVCVLAAEVLEKPA